jgi:hypothetical protein
LRPSLPRGRVSGQRSGRATAVSAARRDPGLRHALLFKAQALRFLVRELRGDRDQSARREGESSRPEEALLGLPGVGRASARRVGSGLTQLLSHCALKPLHSSRGDHPGPPTTRSVSLGRDHQGAATSRRIPRDHSNSGIAAGPPARHRRAGLSPGARTSPRFELYGSDCRWPSENGRSWPAATANGRVGTGGFCGSRRECSGVLPQRPVTRSDRF